MNKSITTVLATTENPTVAKNAAFICAHADKPITATFITEKGKERTMTFVGKHQYNDMFGRKSCKSGRKMVSTKAALGKITVAEMYIPEGVEGAPVTFRPRTINLNTIIKITA